VASACSPRGASTRLLPAFNLGRAAQALGAKTPSFVENLKANNAPGAEQVGTSGAVDNPVLGSASCEPEYTAKLPSYYRSNRHALKRIRKLSDWFIRHRSFRAGNMRKHLGELLAARYKDRSQAQPAQGGATKTQQQKSGAALQTKTTAAAAMSNALAGSKRLSRNVRGGTKDCVGAGVEGEQSIGLNCGAPNGRAGVSTVERQTESVVAEELS